MIGNKALAQVLDAELESAIQASLAADTIAGGDGRTGMRQTALAYFDGELPANDDAHGDPSRSAVSLDVADMIEAVYAQMAPAIEQVGGIEFEATGPDDEAQAARETQIVRAMLMEGHLGDGGFIALTEAIKNALLMRTGTLVLSIERPETRTPEQWVEVPIEAIDEIVKPQNATQRVEGLTVKEEESTIAGRVTFSVELTRIDVDKRLCMQAVAPENFVSSSTEERDPNKSRFCADRMVTTRAQLVEDGFDPAEVSKLKRHDPSSHMLLLQRAGRQWLYAGQEAQVATETVEVWRCYALVGDNEQSARAARYKVYYSRDSKVVLGKPEKVGRVCYAVGNVILYPHRLDGVSMFDKVGEVQALKTNALRAWVENLHKINRPRLGVDESLVNLADVEDATRDVVRVFGPNALQPIPTIDAGPSVGMFLAYQDQCRSERGGASLDMQTSSAQIATNQTASGIERQYSVKEQLAATMARTFAETAMRSAFQIAHYLLRTQWGTPIAAKLGGQWEQVDPSKWRPRNGVMVRVGESRTDKSRKAAALAQVMQAQASMMQAGKAGILTDDSKMHNAATDWIAASELRSPERYLIDPASEQAQQTRQGMQQQQQATMLAQGEASKALLMLEKYKVDVKALTDSMDMIVKAAIEEAKLTLATDPIDQAQEQVEGVAAGAAANAARSSAQ